MKDIGYIVNHVHQITEDRADIKFIGIFRTEEVAKRGILYLSAQPGFKECPDGFTIISWNINTVHWQNGFAIHDSVNVELKDDKIKESEAVYHDLKSVYFLTHIYETDQDEYVRYIGLFSDETLVKSAESNLKHKPGFDSVGLFEYDLVILDKIEWPEGFATVQ